MIRTGTALALTAFLCVPGTTAQAQQVNKPYTTVGQWKVETIFDRSKFFLCRAGTNSQAGLIGLVQYASGRWALSFPDLNVPQGTKLKGMLEMGRASQPVSVNTQKAGLRENFSLSSNMLAALRQGGHMSLSVGGKTWNWYMNDAGLAMGAVQDCVIAAKKSGGVLDQPAPPQGIKTRYQGCYVDRPDRTLPSFLIAQGATRESCAAAAKASGNTYFGLQYGGQCFAGKQPTYQRTLEGDCNMRCTGNQRQVCGGVWRNNVWRID